MQRDALHERHAGGVHDRERDELDSGGGETSRRLRGGGAVRAAARGPRASRHRG